MQLRAKDYRPKHVTYWQFASMAECLALRLDVDQQTIVSAINLYIEGIRGRPCYSARVVPVGSIAPSGRYVDRHVPIQVVQNEGAAWSVNLSALSDETDTVGAMTAATAPEGQALAVKWDATWLTSWTAVEDRYAATLRIDLRARGNQSTGCWIQPFLRVGGAEYSLGRSYLTPEWRWLGGGDGIPVSYNPRGPSRWSMGDWFRILAELGNLDYVLGLRASPSVDVAEWRVRLVHYTRAHVGNQAYAWVPRSADDGYIPLDVVLGPGQYYVLIEPVVVDGLNHVVIPVVEDEAQKTAEVWRRSPDGPPMELVRAVGWMPWYTESTPKSYGHPYWTVDQNVDGDYYTEQSGSANSLAVWGRASGPNPSYILTSGSSTRSGLLKSPQKAPGWYIADFPSVNLGSSTRVTLNDLAPSLMRGMTGDYWVTFVPEVAAATTLNEWLPSGSAHPKLGDAVGQSDEDWGALQGGENTRVLLQASSTAFGGLSGPIVAVTIVARAGGANNQRLDGLLRLSGVDYPRNNPRKVRTGWDMYSWSWTLRPEGGGWTVADVQQFRAGGNRSFGLISLDSGVMATQCYLRVEYGSTYPFLQLIDDTEYADGTGAPYDDYVVALGAVPGLSGVTANVQRALGRVTLSWSTTAPRVRIYRGGALVAEVTGGSWTDYEPPIGQATYELAPYDPPLEGARVSIGAALGPVSHAILGSNQAQSSVALALWPHQVEWTVAPAARYAPGRYRVATVPLSGRQVRIEGGIRTEFFPSRQAAADAAAALAGKVSRLRVPGAYSAWVVLGDPEVTYDAIRESLTLRVDAWEVRGPVVAGV